MSRTYKDRPYKIRFPDWYKERFELYDGFCKRPGVFRKKKKRENPEWNWMSTPMWWIHDFMTVPQRRQGRDWEANIKKIRNLETLIDEDHPNVGRKPHIYYW